MAKLAQKPKGMHRSFTAATKQVFSPQSTRFLASKSTVRGRGFLGALTGFQSKTQKLAWKAQKQVLGNQSAVNIARTSFKQKAYADALAAKKEKIATWNPTVKNILANPLGMKTKKQAIANFFKKPTFFAGTRLARRQRRAKAKVELLESKVKEYNNKAAVAIEKLAQTNIGKATLKPSANGTVVEKNLSSAMNTLKKAYNAKKSGAAETQKIELVQLIKKKQDLDNAVIKTKLAAQTETNPAEKAIKQKAYQAALVAKENYKKTGDPQKIQSLVQVLKKTNKVSQIKFNNLYAVGKGTKSGEKIKAQAKVNASTMINGAKQLKREAKYSSLKKTYEYQQPEKQAMLVNVIKEATQLKETLKQPGRLPTRAEKKTLRRAMKAQAILRTLGRTGDYTVTNPITGEVTKGSLLSNTTKRELSQLKTNTTVDILKSPVEKILGSISVKKTLVDEAKDKVAQVKTKMDSNVAQISSISDAKQKLEKEMANLQTSDPKAIAIQANINKLNAKTAELEAENKILTETFTKTTETYTKLDSEFKIEDATIKLAANKEKIGEFEGQKVRLEAELAAEKLKPTTNTNAMQAIQDKIAAIDLEKTQLEGENKIHTDTITPKVAEQPVAPLKVRTPTEVDTERKQLLEKIAALDLEEKQVSTATAQVVTPAAQPVVPSPAAAPAAITAPVVEKTAAAPVVTPVPPPPVQKQVALSTFTQGETSA